MRFKIESCINFCFFQYLHLSFANTDGHGACGIVMCRSRCLHVKGCSSYTFSQRYLLCFLTAFRSRVSDVPDYVVFALKKEDSIPTDLPCEDGDTVLFTSKGQSRCVSGTKTTDVKHSTRREMKAHPAPWLLLAPLELKLASPFLQLQWSNSNLMFDRSRLRAFTNIKAISYRGSTNQLYIAIGKLPAKRRQTINEFSLTTNKIKYVCPVNNIGKMAVYNPTGALFYNDLEMSCIYKLTGKTRRKELLIENIYFTYSIAVAPNNRFLYVGLQEYVRVYNFNGTSIKFVNVKVLVFAVDPSGENLYYYDQEQTCVFRRPVLSGVSKCLYKADAVWDIAVDLKHVYLNFQGSLIKVIDLPIQAEVSQYGRRGNTAYLMALINRT